MKYELKKTEDGTLTLYNKDFDECYHSVRDGALRESLKKHIEPAWTILSQKDKKQVTVLDICFGLGYNTLATIYHLKKTGIKTKVHIISPEIDEYLVKNLSDFQYPSELEPFRRVVQTLSKDLVYEDEQFLIEVKIGDARDIVKKISKNIDICYQDAFSPKKNPLLWTYEYFRDLKKIASDNFLLTTYSSATPVRMGLYENGFLLYHNVSEGVRSGTVASVRQLPLEKIDMELKKERNPEARSLKDADFKALL
ncbi:tRNA (5-methylaminomethyl-2-thiouridine)(34)-methyltransferase MnmD [Nitrosophilus alvini]|uniref:tRNA (5-methylaminomethyl-2-thiouridine)(34)-methyltransferase MnmD n=1 Tax=Nitrosophilus alvini TaxID=2714855 RepID=UPI00190C1386|nr:MnmC family methyltransferase [Nitrosophilus alvini]